MQSIRRIYVEQIEPYTDTFSRLSHCLTQVTVRSSVLAAMQTFNSQYTRTCSRRFLSHYMVHFYPGDVTGDPSEMTRHIVQSANALFGVNNESTGADVDFKEAFGEYLMCFNAWQLLDKAKLARTYRDVYRLISEIKVSSPTETQEPVERLQRTLDKHTQQIFGHDAHEVRCDGRITDGESRELEQFVLSAVHEIYWQDMTQQLEQNSFDALCGVIGHVKDRMLALCTNPLKRDEVSAYLDVAFLQNVLNAGIAQNQVKSLLLYCLRFLCEYGQPCHDDEIAVLRCATNALYTPNTTNTIQSLVHIIRELARRIDVLVGVVCELYPSDSHTKLPLDDVK
jgi:hypothetical protein